MDRVDLGRDSFSSVFPGDGELAELCRRLDWGATPLGPPDGWPSSLRTLVGTLLTSRHPMVLFWGPEHVQFYNDAYRASPSLKGRHPAALGARGPECWGEVWRDTIGPQVDRVLAGGEATWFENQLVSATRHGRRQDVYWTYGYSPVRGDAGAVAGVLVLCHETTRQVEAEARAQHLATRLATVLESITDALFTLDAEWRLTFVNTEAERLLERTRDQLLGRVLWEAFPDAVDTLFYDEYHRAVRDRVVVRFESFYPPLGRWFTVNAYPSTEGLTVYFQDATGRRATEQRLRAREHMLGVAGRMARIGGWSVDLDSRQVTWSDEVCDIHDVPHGTSVRLDEAIALYAPEWRPVIQDHFTRCIETGAPYDLHLEVITAKGRRLWVRSIGEAVRDASGTIVGLQGAFQDIRPQKRAEEALEESKRRFRELAESMPLIVWSAEPDGAVDFQTRNLREYSGLSADALAGGGWLQVLHPDDVDAVRAAWSHSLGTGDPYQVEFRIRRADGVYRWHLTRALPFRDRDGTVLKWYGSAIDIHDQLELKREAEALAQRLTTTLESITDAFYLLTPEWTFAFLNAEAERLLERRRQDLLGRRLWEAFPATVGSELEAQYRLAARDGTTGAFRYFYPPLSRWFDVRAYPSSAGLAVYFRDVSAERLAELRLREQAELLDRAQDAIFVRDLEHRLEFWNAGAERLYGWARREVLGRPVTELIYSDTTSFEAATRAVVEHGEWTGELEQRRRDGSRLTVEARWSLVRGDAGAPARILAINTDITERKRLLTQFLRAQRMESIGTLAGGIAHDLNNVLAPIVMSIELLKTAITDPQAADVLATIETSALRGADMVRQVLGFARGFDRTDLTFDIGRIVGEVVRVVRDTFPKNIAIRTEVNGGLPPMVGDPTQLQQVLMNLLVNARDAMRDGGLLVVMVERVDLDAQSAQMAGRAAPGPYVQISVSDTGTGMPPDVVARIFDPFFTTKEVGQGTGLGLSTVAAIVSSHRGFVNVSSDLGRGTTFRVYLPAPAVAAAAPGPDWGRRTEVLRGRGEVVLVVDDEESVRAISRQTLEAFGYRVETAVDGADALAIYAKHGAAIDLVLTDMVMPVMDGAALVRALQRLDPDVRIIAASGLGAGGGTGRAAEPGVRHFLSKPYTAETLLRTIRRVLDAA